MRGLPPKTLPLRVAVQGDAALVEALSANTDALVLSPVETSLEISARVTQADVLLVDVSHDTEAGLAAIRGLQLKRPVLALVSAGQAAQALDAGAAGAILRASAPATIAAALAALHTGVAVVDRSFLAEKRRVSLDAPTQVNTEMHVLTNREHEVLGLLADGLSNKEIAAKLEISEHTAKFHVNSILQKMHAQKRVEAVVRAAKMGLITL